MVMCICIVVDAKEVVDQLLEENALLYKFNGTAVNVAAMLPALWGFMVDVGAPGGT